MIDGVLNMSSVAPTHLGFVDEVVLKLQSGCLKILATYKPFSQPPSAVPAKYLDPEAHIRQGLYNRLTHKYYYVKSERSDTSPLHYA